MNRRFTLFSVFSLLVGVFFFLSIDSLWPLPQGFSFTADAESDIGVAKNFLRDAGEDIAAYEGVRLLRRSAALDQAEKSFGRKKIEAWLAGGVPFFRYEVILKKQDESDFFRVDLHPDLGVTGFRKHMEEDEVAARISLEDARVLAVKHLLAWGFDPKNWKEKRSRLESLPQRSEAELVYERILSQDPILREEIRVVLAGKRLREFRRQVKLPAALVRTERKGKAWKQGLETLGFLLLGVGAIAAFFVFLQRLGRGEIKLRKGVWVLLAIFICMVGKTLLQQPVFFSRWDPLWPQAVALFRLAGWRILYDSWLLLVLLAFIAGGEALDRELGLEKGKTLWNLLRPVWPEKQVALASLNGFLTGLLAGGVLALSTHLLVFAVDARVLLQPDGFAFFPLNSLSVPWTTVFFFLYIAMLEELGYRYFGGNLLLKLTGKRWLAIVIPALIYGLTHTNLDFLPPEDPFWARPLVLTAVGAFWGWAYFRFDILTVILSHFSADLFIFNWPRIASGELSLVLPSVLAVAVPLLPAILWSARQMVQRRPEDHLPN